MAELPIVYGRLAKDGTIRVDEDGLEPGRYRVAFQGEIVGEVKVTDPVVGIRQNRADRRRRGKDKGRGVHRRRDLHAARWGRD